MFRDRNIHHLKNKHFNSMHIKKHLGFDALIQDYSDCMNKVVDQRRKASTSYTVHDVMMSALAFMYMQSSSLLDFQTR